MLSVILTMLWLVINVLAVPALPPESVLLNRLEGIKAEMSKMRFCYNDSCFYRYLNIKFIPPDRATISAGIDRPSASPDQADYHFQFIDGRWQLLSGEEYTDVADFSFKGDRYEINGVHSSRVQKGDIYTAKRQGNLRAGYVNLYFEVLDEGKERI